MGSVDFKVLLRIFAVGTGMANFGWSTQMRRFYLAGSDDRMRVSGSALSRPLGASEILYGLEFRSSTNKPLQTNLQSPPSPCVLRRVTSAHRPVIRVKESHSVCSQLSVIFCQLHAGLMLTLVFSKKRFKTISILS
jgi:hypothetical protein